MTRRPGLRFSAALVPLLVSLAAPVAARQAHVGMLEISGTPAEERGPFDWLIGSADPTLDDLVAAIEAAGDSAELRALVVRLKDCALSATQVEELGAAIRYARGAGKTVHIFGEMIGPADLLLASYADEVILQAGGMVSFPGLYMEEMFLADTLAWAGVKADMVQIGDYKGASEMLANTSPSPAWERNISALLDALYERQRETIKRNRGMDDAELDAALLGAWAATADEARALGLIDAAIDLPDLGDHLANKVGGKVAWEDVPVGDAANPLDMANPFALFQTLLRAPRNTTTGETLAVVHIAGPIIDGDSGSGLLGGRSVGSRTIRNALEDLREDENIRGVIVRVDSPGGSATASEVIWQGIRRLAEKKPVWTSVGSMAASGGYYVSVAGSKIYVNPSSIVGSIGVVGGKIAMGGLYEKMRINVVARSRGPMAAMQGSLAPWSEHERAQVRAMMQKIYALFTDRVAAGRPGIDLSRTAEGRLFTGEDAVRLRMADEVGGLTDALTAMAAQLGLAEYDVKHYPAPKSLNELLEETLGSAGRRAALDPSPLPPLAAALRETIGAREWPRAREMLGALLLLREQRVLLAMPRALIFR